MAAVGTWLVVVVVDVGRGQECLVLVPRFLVVGCWPLIDRPWLLAHGCLSAVGRLSSAGGRWLVGRRSGAACRLLILGP